jgi:hypothetical protein
MQDVSRRSGEKVGVIEYETLGDMENALRKLDDSDLHGSRVRLYEVFELTYLTKKIFPLYIY